MPHLETWDNLPPGIRQHLMDRMRDRRISIADLNKLRIWVESHPPGKVALAIGQTVLLQLFSTSEFHDPLCQPVNPG
jgi:hypothetical protein